METIPAGYLAFLKVGKSLHKPRQAKWETYSDSEKKLIMHWSYLYQQATDLIKLGIAVEGK
jgi:hypothetical protein